MEAEKIIEISVVAITGLVFTIWLIWQLKKKGMRQFAVDMIVKAEDMFNAGENEEKMNYVIDKIISIMPLPLRFLITRETIKAFIQGIFDEIKNALDYKKGE